MAATVTDPLLGTVVDGRYEVLSRIARGGMATVYLAQDRRLDRRVALKVMHPHLADGSDVVARFRREARAAARLSHPGVVGVYDQGIEGAASYLTMEYVDGATLRRRLATRGALSLGESITILDAVLDALGAAHRAGLVHRDVKPENVLISRDGTVKVADFGLARAVTEATMSTTGALLGTVAYLSPEIVTSGAADARADVYAVGVMFYEMLTGHQPFEGETPIQVAYKHVHETIPPPSDEVAWLPLEIDELVAAFTARNPDERPRSADAALRELRRVRAELDDHALSLRADVDPDEVAQLAHEATDDVEREGYTAAVPTHGGSGTIALPIGVVREDDAEEPATEDRVRQRRRSRRVKAIIAFVLILATLGGGVWWYMVVGPGAYTEVPDVTGRAESTGLATLEGAGLVPSTEAEYSDDIPLGHIIRTEPGAGERIEREGEIVVVVSQGVLRITVPDVTGQSPDAAQDLLEAEELDGSILVEEAWDQEIPEGQVIRSDPPAGSVVNHDVDITLVVSQGREPITVPDVLGDSAADAEQQLLDVGAVPQVGGEEFSDDVPQGHVIRQDVTGPALRGDPVTLVVSKGPELFEVPNVFGDQYRDAAAELQALGFVVERENVLGGVFGTVHSQSVAAGELRPRGTVIVLTVV